MAEFTHKVEFVEFDSSCEEHVTNTYYEEKEVKAAISRRDHKYSVLEKKYRNLSNSYNELLKIKVDDNSEYWKKKYTELLNAIKSVEETQNGKESRT